MASQTVAEIREKANETFIIHLNIVLAKFHIHKLEFTYRKTFLNAFHSEVKQHIEVKQYIDLIEFSLNQKATKKTWKFVSCNFPMWD